MAQVARAADVDVAHHVVVRPRKDREEVELLRGSLHGVVRVLQAAQLHLRLQEAVLLLRCADGPRPAPGWPTSGSSSPRRCPRSSRTLERARHGDVVLFHAPRGAGLLRALPHRAREPAPRASTSSARSTLEARHVWLMSRQWGVLFEGLGCLQ